MHLFDRINISLILKKHIETFYNYGELNFNGKRTIPLSDKITFIFSPIIVTLIVVISGIRLTNDYVNIIITSLSIFVGLLFNLLILIFDLTRKQKSKLKEFEVKTEVVPRIDMVKFTILKELYANICFAIAVSIFAIAAAIAPTLKPKLILPFLRNIKYYHSLKDIYIFLTNSIAIFLSILFLLTLLMILKRFFLIFNNEINER